MFKKKKNNVDGKLATHKHRGQFRELQQLNEHSYVCTTPTSCSSSNTSPIANELRFSNWAANKKTNKPNAIESSSESIQWIISFVKSLWEIKNVNHIMVCRCSKFSLTSFKGSHRFFCRKYIYRRYYTRAFRLEYSTF